MLQHSDDGGMRDVAPSLCFISYICGSNTRYSRAVNSLKHPDLRELL